METAYARPLIVPYAHTKKVSLLLYICIVFIGHL